MHVVVNLPRPDVAMKIELTDQQEQTAKQGRPVEVVDPASGRAFVIVNRDLYERLRSSLERSSQQGSSEQGPPPPVLPAAPSPGEGEPVRVRLRDLPNPPDMVEAAERLCKKYGWWGKQGRREVEEQLKLQYYYGGQALYILRTTEGPVIVPIAQRYKDTPDLRYVLLTAEERPRASFTVPPRWRDAANEILT
jgi:hypothetical protein